MEQIVSYSIAIVLISITSWILFSTLLTKSKNIPFQFQKITVKSAVQYGSWGMQGIRPTMEDDYIIDKIPFLNSQILITGICDGHCGSRCSKFVARHFCTELTEQIKQAEIKFNLKNLSLQEDIDSSNAKQFSQILEKTVLEMDKRWCNTVKQFGINDGTTLCVNVFFNEKLFTVNLGDSRSVASNNFIMQELTQDFKPSRDKAYVEAIGGFVHPLIIKTPQNIIYNGSERVYPGGLSLSRTIGDYSSKNMDYLNQLGVIRPVIQNQPEVSLCTSTPEFVITCCDGICDVASSIEIQRACIVIIAILQSNSVKKHELLVGLGISVNQQRYLSNADILAQCICRQALGLGSTDNVSAVVVIFEKLWLPNESTFCNKELNPSKSYREFVQSYNQTDFQMVLTKLVEEFWYDGEGNIQWRQLQDWFKVAFSYFKTGDQVGEVKFFDVKSENLEDLQKEKSLLWEKLESEGKTLSQLRQGVEETGIVEEEDYKYEILHQ